VAEGGRGGAFVGRRGVKGPAACRVRQNELLRVRKDGYGRDAGRARACIVGGCECFMDGVSALCYK